MSAWKEAEAAFNAYYERGGTGQADDVWKRIATRFGVLHMIGDPEEMYGASRCGVCEEPFTGSRTEEVGEWYDPHSPTDIMNPHEHVIAHAQCGIDAGYELA